MRPALLAVTLFAATLTVAACSSNSTSTNAAQSSTADATSTSSGSAAPTTHVTGTALTVQAGTGTERFGVPDVVVQVTSCANDANPTTLKTGRDGNATQSVAAGCYRATVTSVPSGCSPDAVATGTVDVKQNDNASIPFLIHCA